MKFAGKWMELEKDHLHPYPEQKKNMALTYMWILAIKG